jgi:gliding motility-associated-like protein
MFAKKIFSFVCFFCFLFNSKAQLDTSFWFAAPDFSQGLGDRPIYIYINTYNQPSTVTLSQPANLSFLPIIKIIPANSIDSINLTPFISNIENNVPNAVLNKGLYVSSTQKISVLYSINSNFNKEFFSFKGSKALGKDFYVPMQEFWNQSPATIPKSYSSFEIVATQNTTTVLITPKANIIGRLANVTFTVLLQRGQTFSCQDTSRSASTSLAGSIISSNNPIAISVHSSGLSQFGCRSSVGDQITNSSFIGTDYIINKGAGNIDKVFILATQNGTQLTINDGTTTLTPFLNFSQTHVYSLSNSIAYIKSNKPIYVFHVSGYGCRLSGAQVPAFYCAGTFSASFTRTSIDSLAVNVFTRSGFEGNFSLNGNPLLIPSSSFTNVPGSSGLIKTSKLYFSTSTIPVGSHNTITNSGDIFGLGIINGSHANGSAYAYVSDFSAQAFTNAGSDYTICANGSISLNGIIGGGNVLGTWSTNGFGSFTSSLSILSNTYIPSQIDTTVKPVKIYLTSNGPCSITKDTLLLSVKPSPIVNASVDQIICANTVSVNLNGSVLGGATTGMWTSAGTGTFVPNSLTLNAMYLLSASDIASGSVKLILTSTGSGICALERDTMKITITPAPFVNAGPVSYSVCANNPTLTVNGIVGGATTTGKWTTSGSGNFSPSNIILNTNYFPSSTDVAAGQISLYLSSTNNLTCNPSKDSIIVVFTSPPSVNAGLDLFVCKNNSNSVLSGIVSGPTATGIWTGGSGSYLPSNSVLNPTYTPSNAEVSAGYVFLLLTSTANGNCNASSDIVKINFVPKPFANFNFYDVCLNQQTLYSDYSIAGVGMITQWNWNFGDFTSSNLQNPVHTYTSSGTFTTQLVAQNSYGCRDTIKRATTIYPLPNSNFGIGRICTGAFLNLIFSDSTTVAAPETISQYFWDFGGPGISNLQNPIQLFPGSGLYNIKLITTSNHGCKDTIVKQTNLSPRPIAGFAYSISSGLTVGTNVNVIDTSKYTSQWNWNFGNGIQNILTQNASQVYYSNGVYVITQIAYDNYGCSDTARVAVRINNITNEIYSLIPNAISPNGDGKNDVWKLDFISILYPQTEVDIFNVWGQNIYHSVGYNEPWNGKFNGHDLPVGNYYYVINLNDSSNTEQLKGSILLIR